MIKVESRLFVADNSGAKIVLCIKILGFSIRKYATIGDLVKITVKKCIFKSKVKKGNIYNAVVVRISKNFNRFDGSYIKFSNNAVVLLNNKLEPIGTRITGPIPKELKYTKFFKLLSLSSNIL